jgi:putative heme-binding domain-containing protein
VNVNPQGKYEAGLYRVKDTDGDDRLDKLEPLRQLEGRGEHGPHAVLLAPDGKSLYVVCGNGTKLTNFSDSRVPRHWGEDHLLPRMPDGRGFMRDVLAPGGVIYRIDPEGEKWEIVANGFRNEYDAAVNRDGELFAYDADMEWDMNTPWYRPTRVNHVISGAEFGWRNGAGKWPAWYPDSFGAVVNVGPGSPTGVTFGYGAKFPAKYEEALFICDWSYGKLYAVHLTPTGATYTGVLEEFVAGTPLPLTDLVINPQDGAMYFAIGGRDTQSGLYRVTYTGPSDAATTAALEVPAADPQAAELRALRHKLEALHRPTAGAVDTIWPYLGHPDRAVRFAARTALEHQDHLEWVDRAIAEKEPTTAIYALLALVRSTADCPFHRNDGGPAPDQDLAAIILGALERIDYANLLYERKLDLVRVYHVLFNRFGPPAAGGRDRTIARFDAVYPAESPALNAEIANLLVFLEAPTVAAKTMALLEEAPTQEEQIDYARALRVLKTGWTPELRQAQFEWFVKAMSYRGGNSFELFVTNIRNDAIATLTPAETAALAPILDKKPEPTQPILAVKPRPVVKEWKPDEVLALAQSGLSGRNFDRGRQMFAAANCFACHRYDNAGGAIGPDLSSLAGRFGVREVVESIMEPSKVVSDQYQAVTVVTDDGREITGRIVNLKGNTFMINTNMLDPNALEPIDRTAIESQTPAKLSMMPTGLLNTLKEDEILDLLAYLLSRGDRNHAMFQKSGE